MKVFRSILHSVIDYVFGPFLIISPWVLNFANQGAQTWVCVFLGCAIAIYSLITRYEQGIFKIVPFRLHLIFDLIAGLILGLSPWVFGFSEHIYISHVVMAALFITMTLMTHTQVEDPSKEIPADYVWTEVHHH